MPTSAAGHLPSPKRSSGFAQAGAAARLKAMASLQIGQQDPPVPPQSRRISTPPAAPLAKRAPSNTNRIAQHPACRRLIPIDREGRTTELKSPAVSSPEACPTPADRGKAPHPPVSGRRPTTLNTSGSRDPLAMSQAGSLVRTSRGSLWHAPPSSLPHWRARSVGVVQHSFLSA